MYSSSLSASISIATQSVFDLAFHACVQASVSPPSSILRGSSPLHQLSIISSNTESDDAGFGERDWGTRADAVSLHRDLGKNGQLSIDTASQAGRPQGRQVSASSSTTQASKDRQHQQTQGNSIHEGPCIPHDSPVTPPETTAARDCPARNCWRHRCSSLCGQRPS